MEKTILKNSEIFTSDGIYLGKLIDINDKHLKIIEPDSDDRHIKSCYISSSLIANEEKDKIILSTSESATLLFEAEE